jgi:hypothetical protein
VTRFASGADAESRAGLTAQRAPPSAFGFQMMSASTLKSADAFSTVATCRPRSSSFVSVRRPRGSVRRKAAPRASYRGVTRWVASPERGSQAAVRRTRGLDTPAPQESPPS